MAETKRCGRCELDRPVGEFGKRARSKDGLQLWCRACCAIYNHERYQEVKAKLARLEELEGS